MHDIIAKIARLAASKAAAFCYAVAVGVAGNMIFHYVQLQGPVAAAVPHAARQSSGAAEPAAIMPRTPPAAPPQTRVSLPAAPIRPPAPKPTAAERALPEPPAALALPSPASLPAPPLKPTALPPPSAPPPTPAREGGAGTPDPAPAVSDTPPIGHKIDAAAPPARPAIAEAPPIPLPPSLTKPATAESTEASSPPARPGAPGPGSGGLY